MPIVYDELHAQDERNPNEISFSFNDQEAQPAKRTKFNYKHIGGSTGVSTVVTAYFVEYLVDDYLISVVCEDVDAFVRHQTKKLAYFSLTLLKRDGNQNLLEPIINRVCRCLENSLQSRNEKLKVERIDLSVLEISQAVSAVNLLDQEILQAVGVHLPFEERVFKADDFIPLIEGQRQQRLDLGIMLYEFSLQVLEEVRKLLTYTSKLNSIIIAYTIIDERCIELIAEAGHSSDGETVKFLIYRSNDPIEEMTMLNLFDNKCPINIFEIPSIMRSIASNLEFSQIQSLRKVSRGIRHCVDYIKPDPHILVYFMFLKNSSSVNIEGMINGKIEGNYKGSLEQDAVQINLPQSPVFWKFKILIKTCSAEYFLASLGEPYRVVNNLKYIWFFRIENTIENTLFYLHIMFEQGPLPTGGRLQFAKVHQNDTPFF
ncbi:hypothetical protein GCK72_021254 [Caenorhabditis remanei]|uniref:Uncharacterized protein n=1 Tax=Caenorhabditis remanei TaxID=31234 RepID=A0A6A5GHM8_CAERE|nr:hypothetical protein GCK72_021254 [Caenorhabditis remanei]KAF1754690.1 hypothetical protein GCK72_021254 [Caenorhabditis remanei]